MVYGPNSADQQPMRYDQHRPTLDREVPCGDCRFKRAFSKGLQALSPSEVAFRSFPAHFAPSFVVGRD